MRKALPRLLLGVALPLLCLATILASLRHLAGEPGLIEVGDDEVALIYDQRSGATRQLDAPGKQLYLPFAERVHLLRRSPRRLLMQGTKREGAARAPEVRLRASDGTLVRFESLAAQYALRPDAARTALEDTRGDAALVAGLIEAHARAILRDEYGRFSSEEILLRENQLAAHARSVTRLNAALRPHGLEVLDLSTPRLRFDSAYEQSVENRKLAFQEIERLRAEFRQLEAEGDQRLAALEKQKLIELNATRLEVEDYLAKMERVVREQRREAERYAAGRLAAAAQRKYDLEQDALATSEAARLRSAVERRAVEALERTGPALLREAWAERLAQTNVRIRPYRHDPAPAGIEVLETALAGN